MCFLLLYSSCGSEQYPHPHRTRPAGAGAGCPSAGMPVCGSSLGYKYKPVASHCVIVRLRWPPSMQQCGPSLAIFFVDCRNSAGTPRTVHRGCTPLPPRATPPTPPHPRDPLLWCRGVCPRGGRGRFGLWGGAATSPGGARVFFCTEGKRELLRTVRKICTEELLRTVRKICTEDS